ncbi:TetR/AcrR family transcriptional regulator [Williamsia sp. SKLECPSW1]
MPAGQSARRQPRAERRDAVENREKILRTAADLIAVRGHTVPLSEIADAAGVGVGTFYRAFPDRAGLLAELQRRGYGLLLAALTRIKADGLTGADAIEAYLEECLVMANQLVAMPLRGGRPLADDDAVEAKVRIGEAIGDFLAEGRADGTVHADISAFDVIVCGTLIATPLPYGPDWPTTARRHVQLFIRAIRTRPGHPSG